MPVAAPILFSNRLQHFSDRVTMYFHGGYVFAVVAVVKHYEALMVSSGNINLQINHTPL